MGRARPFGQETSEKTCPRRVLVVDDEDSIRMLFRKMLTQAGYEVEEAGDGGQAVEVLGRSDNPLMLDTTIGDSRRPQIDGVEAIRCFRTQYSSPPVIVLTGSHGDRLVQSLVSLTPAHSFHV
ncbi:MAG: response regulator [Nitrospira sp.]|nr:response regulator [Nitrospira sp.]